MSGSKFKLAVEIKFNQIENLERQEFIGLVECEIHDIVCAPTQSIARPIVNKSNRKRNGILNIRGAEYDMGGNKILFQIGCLQFPTRSEVVLRMSYFTENKDWMPIHATEPLKNQKKSTLVWNEFFLPLSIFGNNEQAQVKLEVEEYSKTMGTILLRVCELTLQGMMENSGEIKDDEKWIDSGTIEINISEITQQIQLLLALGFYQLQQTSTDNSNLHTFQSQNDYVGAITQKLGILQYYNNENRFWCQITSLLQYCKSLFCLLVPVIYLIHMFMEALRKLSKFIPCMVLLFSLKAIQFASCETIDQQNQKYFILCILTDGCINDMQQTIDQIFEAQKYPLSIFIVGIGNEDFTNMRILDGDDPESKLHSKKNDGNVSRDLEKLAKETLAEIPKQFLEFMEINKIYPAKGKKNTKATTNDFIHTKIEEMRKLKKKEIGLAGKTSKFLKEQKEQFIEQLVILGYDRMIVSNIVQDGIPAKDVNQVNELISELQKQKAQSESKKIYRFKNRSEINSKIQSIQFDPRVSHRVFCIIQKNKLDELLQSKKWESQLVTTNFLFTIDQHRKKSPIKTYKEPHKFRAIDPTIQQNNNNNGNNLCLGCGVNPEKLMIQI